MGSGATLPHDRGDRGDYYALVPSGPVVEPSEVETNDPAIEVTVRWGDRDVLRVVHLCPPRDFVIGERPDVDFAMESSFLGALSLTLASPHGDGVAVKGPEGATIDVVGPDAARAGEREVIVRKGDVARVRFKGFEFEVTTVRAGRAPRTLLRPDRVLLSSIVGTFVVVLALFVGTAFALPRPVYLGDVEVDLTDPAIVAFLASARPPEVPIDFEDSLPDDATIERFQSDREPSLTEQPLFLIAAAFEYGPRSVYGADFVSETEFLPVFVGYVGAELSASERNGGIHAFRHGSFDPYTREANRFLDRVATITIRRWVPLIPQAPVDPVRASRPIVRLTASPEVRGDLPVESVGRVLRRNLGRLEQCYWRAVMTRAPALAGQMTVSFVIAADGSVRSPSARGTLRDGETTRCVADAIRAVHFPAPLSPGLVHVRFTADFISRGTLIAPVDPFPPPTSRRFDHGL